MFVDFTIHFIYFSTAIYISNHNRIVELCVGSYVHTSLLDLLLEIIQSPKEVDSRISRSVDYFMRTASVPVDILILTPTQSHNLIGLRLTSICLLYS
jgi:hypothetical protein